MFVRGVNFEDLSLPMSHGFATEPRLPEGEKHFFLELEVTIQGLQLVD